LVILVLVDTRRRLRRRIRKGKAKVGEDCVIAEDCETDKSTCENNKCVDPITSRRRFKRTKRIHH